LACYRTASALGTVDGTAEGGEALSAGKHNDAQKILIVEDDQDIREGLTSFLEDRGYEVVTAPNGLAALEKLRWGLRPCVILLDLRMTVMTGWEFRAEQKKDLSLASIPVVAMTTGRWKPEDLSDFPEHLEKPLDLQLLQDVLTRYCEEN
jgi:CheY-like chemotaxis protein